MAHQLEAGEACPVCGSHEHPAKSVHQTELVNLVAFEELKQELQEKQEAFLTFEKVYNDCKSEGRSQRDIVDNLQQDLGEEWKDVDMITINQHRTTCQQMITDLDRQQKESTLLRSEEHTSELQSRGHLVCRLLLAKKN